MGRPRSYNTLKQRIKKARKNSRYSKIISARWLRRAQREEDIYDCLQSILDQVEEEIERLLKLERSAQFSYRLKHAKELMSLVGVPYYCDKAINGYSIKPMFNRFSKYDKKVRAKLLELCDTKGPCGYRYIFRKS